MQAVANNGINHDWVAPSGRIFGNVDMATANVLVVAPDTAFGHSIAFALESGGFNVALHRYADEAFVSPDALDAACAVVDDNAIDDWKRSRELFDSFGRPVILLLSLLRSVPDLPVAKHLTKPFLGEPLIEAVLNVIAGQQ
jgi:hypothetical protein